MKVIVARCGFETVGVAREIRTLVEKLITEGYIEEIENDGIAFITDIDMLNDICEEYDIYFEEFEVM